MKMLFKAFCIAKVVQSFLTVVVTECKCGVIYTWKRVSGFKPQNIFLSVVVLLVAHCISLICTKLYIGSLLFLTMNMDLFLKANIFLCIFSLIFRNQVLIVN